jgi:4-amino-4-deoxy-L-arabinose transferase-like glycosyltransferase
MAIAGVVPIVLILLAHGYGYHRDELYFMAAGRHLDWAYADQGPVTPLIARIMTDLAPGSLTVLRIPSALAAGSVVLLAGLTTRDLGGDRRAMGLAAAVTGVSVMVLFTGHLLSTSTFDLLCWTAVTFLVVRAVRRHDDRMWLAAGLVLGLGLLNKPLPAFLAVSILLGIVISGPRRLLGDRWMWGGAVLAGLLAMPFVLWQAAHGWPQLEVASAIAGGGSASSEPWWAVVPFQLLLVSPLLAPVWIVGLIRLLWSPSLRDVRFIGVAWIVLAVVFTVTAGKPYYLAGLLPMLIAAGSVGVAEWLSRGSRWRRRSALGVAIAGSAMVTVVIALPVLPVEHIAPVVAVNEDVGETVGWPELVQTVSEVHRGSAVVFTANYGEAGAVDRFGPSLGIARAFSGHNAYGDWGPPPDGARPVVVVGLPGAEAKQYFTGCTRERRISNVAGLGNEEQGKPVMLCSAPRLPWSVLWPSLRHLG